MSLPHLPAGSQWAPLIAPKKVADSARRDHADWHNCPTFLTVQFFGHTGSADVPRGLWDPAAVTEVDPSETLVVGRDCDAAIGPSMGMRRGWRGDRVAPPHFQRGDRCGVGSTLRLLAVRRCSAPAHMRRRIIPSAQCELS